MDNQFEIALNSKKNLELTLKFVKELNLIKNIPTNKRIIDILPIVKKHKVFFGLFNCKTYSDHIFYDLDFGGKNIIITKTSSYDDAYGGDFHKQIIVNIKLKTLLKLTKTN